MACKITLNNKEYTEQEFKSLLENGLLFHLLDREVVDLPINQTSLKNNNEFREIFPENKEDLYKAVEKIFGLKGEKAKATVELTEQFARGYQLRHPNATLEDYYKSITFIKPTNNELVDKTNVLFTGLEDFKFVDDMQFEDDDNRASYTVYKNGDDIGQVEIQINKDGEHYVSWVSRLKELDENNQPKKDEEGNFIYKGENGDGTKILKQTMQNLLNRGYKVGIDQNITSSGFKAMKRLADEGFLEQIGEEITEPNQKSLKPMFYETTPFKVLAQPNEDSLLFQSTNKPNEILSKVVNGFQLEPSLKGFGVAFKSKNEKATPQLAERITNWIKETLGIDNIKFVYEKTYGTVNAIYTEQKNQQQTLFQDSEKLNIKEETKDILDDVTDEKIGEKKYQSFNIEFEDGGRAFGKIEDGIVKLSGIEAGRISDGLERKKGTKVYERVIQKLSEKGFNILTVNTQSLESQKVLNNLVEKGILENPRGIIGSSGNEHPTTFTINNNLLNQQAQAAILLQDTKDIIYSLSKPNVSSLPHELTHKFQRELTDIERQYVIDSYNENNKLTEESNIDINKSLSGEDTFTVIDKNNNKLSESFSTLQEAKDFLNQHNNSNKKTDWDTDVSEHFARGFEKYLYDGVAPTSALQELFNKFSKWLKDIYKGILYSNIDIELNDHMKNIYSQMLGVNYEADLKQEVQVEKKSKQQEELDKLLAKMDAPLSFTEPITKDILNPTSTTGRIELAFIRKEYDDLIKDGTLTINQVKEIAKSAKIPLERVEEIESRLSNPELETTLELLNETDDVELKKDIEENLQEPETKKVIKKAKFKYFVYTINFGDIESQIEFSTKKELDDYLKRNKTSLNDKERYRKVSVSREDNDGSKEQIKSPYNREYEFTDEDNIEEIEHQKILGKSNLQENNFSEEQVNQVKETLSLLFNTSIIQTSLRNFFKTTTKGKEYVTKYLDQVNQPSKQEYINNVLSLDIKEKEVKGKTQYIYKNRTQSLSTIKSALDKQFYGEVSALLISDIQKNTDEVYNSTFRNTKTEAELLSRHSAAFSQFVLSDKNKELVEEKPEEFSEKKLLAKIKETQTAINNNSKKILYFRVNENDPNKTIDQQQEENNARVVRNNSNKQYLRDLQERLSKIVDKQIKEEGVKEYKPEDTTTKDLEKQLSKLTKERNNLNERIEKEQDKLFQIEEVQEDEDEYEEDLSTEKDSKLDNLTNELSKVEEQIATINKKILGVEEPVETKEQEYEEVRGVENMFFQRPDRDRFPSKEDFDVEDKKFQSLYNISKWLAKKFPQIDIKLGYFNGNFKGKIEGTTVFINLNKATLDTPFHEMMHPFVAALRETNPELYGSLIGQVQDTLEYAEVLADPEYNKLSEDDILDEIITRSLSNEAKEFFNEDGTINKEALEAAKKEKPILVQFLKWILNKIKEVVGNSIYFSKLTNLVDNPNLLNFSLRDLSISILATNETKILYQGEMGAIQKLNAYQRATKEQADSYLKTLERKLKQLVDVDRKVGNADLAIFEANQIRRILADFDGVEAVQEFLRFSIFGLDRAAQKVDQIKEEFSKLNNGFEKVYNEDIESENYGRFTYQKTSDKSLLTQDIINNLNRDLAEAVQLMSFYDSSVGVYDFYLDKKNVFDREETAIFDNAFTNAEKKKRHIKGLMLDLTTEWLFPKIEEAQRDLSEDKKMSKQEFREKLKYSDQHISPISYWAGAAINQRDPLTAIVATEVADKMNKNSLKESNDNVKLRKLFTEFLRKNNIPNSTSKVIEYYKQNYLRKAKTYELVSIDKEGNKTYGYVERDAFHEDFKYDEFDKDLRAAEEKYKKEKDEPKTDREWKSFNDFKFDWIKNNTQQINNEQKPSNKYKNQAFDALKNDEYYQFLYKLYKEGNTKYGERGLDYGVVPQAYNKKSFIERKKEQFSSSKEYIKDLKGKPALEKSSNLLVDTANYLFDQNEYEKQLSKNLDGTYYRGVNSPFTHLINPEDVDLSLNESVLTFQKAANTYNELRDIQANVENLRQIINGNFFLGIQPREVTKLSKKIDPKTGKLVPTFTTDGMPQVDEKQTKRMANLFNTYINDNFYGVKEIESNFKVGKVNVSANKIAKNLGFFTATVNLAGNLVAGLSNVVVGNIQSLGEAVGGKYYGVSDWLKAQGMYAAASPQLLADLSRPVKSKLTQLGIIYDAIQGEFRDKYGKNITGNILQRYFTKDSIFFVSHMGEHQIQLTGFLALMNATKVKLQDGSEISLYDAYTKNDKGFYKIRPDAIWTEKDNDKFTRTLHGISKDLNGNYASIDKGVAQRHFLGRLAFQYRKYLYPAWRARFGSKRFDYERETEIEGYYISFGKKYVEDLFSFRFNTLKFLANQKPYTKEEAYAARKTMFDAAIMIGMTLLGAMLMNMESPDDDDKKLRDRLLYTALNLRKDIAGYSVLAPAAGVQIITNPAASFRNLTNVLKLSQQFFNDATSGGFETYKKSGQGYEEGDTKLGHLFEKNIPFLNQIERWNNPQDQVKYLTLTNQDIQK